jgi:aryl carrier-like protein
MLTVRGVAPVPPVVPLAALLETAQEADPGAEFELRDVRLGDTPLLAEAADRTTLRVTVDGPHGDGHLSTGTATVHALLRDGPAPVFCATAGLVRTASGDADRRAGGALDAALARCRDYVGAEAFLTLARRHGVEIGGPLRAVQHLWRRDGEAVARVRLPRPLGRLGWEAGLLPLLAACELPGAADSPLVPVSFDAVRLHAEPEPDFWSLSTVRPGAAPDAVLADALLLAPDGRVLAVFSGIRLRRPVPAAPAQTPLARIPELVSALAGPYVGPLTGAVKKVAAPFGTGLLGELLRPAARFGTTPSAASPAPPATAPASTPASPAEDTPAERRARVGDAAEALLDHAADLLGMPASTVDERRSLRELGLDSLMASQLRQRLRRSHGVEISAGRLLGAESLAILRASLTNDDAGPDGG